MKINKIFLPIIICVAIAIGLLLGNFINNFLPNATFSRNPKTEKLNKLINLIDNEYVDAINTDSIVDLTVNGILEKLDPHSVYIAKNEVEEVAQSMKGDFVGIGINFYLYKDSVVVIKPIKNGPSDKAGIKPGDRILFADKFQLFNKKISNETLFSKLKGEEGSNIELTVYRKATNKKFKVNITRDVVPIKSVDIATLIDDKTGYIVLSTFNRKTTTETKEALEKLKADGAERIILDLRGNGGGLLNEAVNICNLFVAKGESIVTTKSKVEKYNVTYKTTREPADLTIPLAILVDGRSASASEIVAGALQDLDRAVIVGSRSFGKGLVQRPVDMTYGTQVKVTISRYYTPSGRCIQALDYWHKDKDGKAVRTDASKYNAFKTKKGRTVYDGGGIQPDIELAETKLSTISEVLQRNDGIFNYVTYYYFKNPSLGDKIPTLTDADFNDFKTFLKKEKFTFDTETELALKNTLEKAKKEKLDETIITEYNQLLAALQRSEEALLDKNKKEIQKLMLDEIIKRYQYKEGLYNYYTKNNFEITKAKEVLANTAQYTKILQ